MRYELFLRGDSLADAVIDEARARAEEARLVVELFSPEAEDGLRGLDLGVELDAPATRVEALCELAFALARQNQATVFDPQLGRSVDRTDTETIVEHFENSAGFSRRGYVPAYAPTTQPASTRLWLTLGGLVLFVLVVARALSCAAR